MQNLSFALFTGGAGGGGGGGATDPDFASVKLLLHFNGTNGSTTVIDSSGSPATCTARNGAALSTATPKYGSAALTLDGANDDVDTNRAQNVGAGAFTLEAWVNPSAAQTGRIISAQSSVLTNAVITLRVNDTGALTFILRDLAGGGTVVLTTATGLVTMDGSTWAHVAATRGAADRIDIWLNGVSVANTTSATSPSASAPYNIGSQYGLAEFFAGKLDDVRVTEGVCRYTAAFTPPTAEFPNS